MPEYWTIEQAQANAELFAQEFSNRQILIIGLGNPTLNAPIGAEYEDRSFVPAIRYRKVGKGVNQWQKLVNVEHASKDDVLNGTDENKVVSPARLTEKLTQFGQQIAGLPQEDNAYNSSAIEIQLTAIENLSTFKIVIPESLNATMASIQLNSAIGNCELASIEGGQIGQIIILKRSHVFELLINSAETLKVSQPMLMKDAQLLDNLTLQKIATTLWVEVARKEFQE